VCATWFVVSNHNIEFSNRLLADVHAQLHPSFRLRSLPTFYLFVWQSPFLPITDLLFHLIHACVSDAATPFLLIFTFNVTTAKLPPDQRKNSSGNVIHLNAATSYRCPGRSSIPTFTFGYARPNANLREFDLGWFICYFGSSKRCHQLPLPRSVFNTHLRIPAWLRIWERGR
jgi:hypothetical protein